MSELREALKHFESYGGPVASFAAELALGTYLTLILEGAREHLSCPKLTKMSWCAEHGAEAIDNLSGYCWHGYYLSGDPVRGTLECDMIDRLVEVIPDDY